jgi:hypothetical protein
MASNSFQRIHFYTLSARPHSHRRVRVDEGCRCAPDKPFRASEDPRVGAQEHAHFSSFLFCPLAGRRDPSPVTARQSWYPDLLMGPSQASISRLAELKAVLRVLFQASQRIHFVSFGEYFSAKGRIERNLEHALATQRGRPRTRGLFCLKLINKLRLHASACDCADARHRARALIV